MIKESVEIKIEVGTTTTTMKVTATQVRDYAMEKHVMENEEILTALYQTQKKSRNTNNANIDNNINEKNNDNSTNSRTHVAWAQDFSHSNNDNFNFLQHKIKGHFDSILMNTS